jgi:hypothetical protein
MADVTGEHVSKIITFVLAGYSQFLLRLNKILFKLNMPNSSWRLQLLLHDYHIKLLTLTTTRATYHMLHGVRWQLHDMHTSSVSNHCELESFVICNIFVYMHGMYVIGKFTTFKFNST